VRQQSNAAPGSRIPAGWGSVTAFFACRSECGTGKTENNK